MIIINFENNANEIRDELYINLANRLCSHILKREGCSFDCEISVILTVDDEIRKTNLDFREKDMATDVLSFPNFDFDTPADFAFLEHCKTDFEYFNPENNALYLGDIMISDERARLQAKEYGHSYTREFAFLLAHSILHLIGYDHMEPAEAEIMEKKQSDYLDELGITREITFETLKIND